MTTLSSGCAMASAPFGRDLHLLNGGTLAGRDTSAASLRPRTCHHDDAPAFPSRPVWALGRRSIEDDRQRDRGDVDPGDGERRPPRRLRSGAVTPAVDF